MKAPKYAVLGRTSKNKGTTMRLDGNRYYRDNGAWGVGFKIEDGKVIAVPVCENTSHLAGIEFTEITKKEWAEENR